MARRPVRKPAKSTVPAMDQLPGWPRIELDIEPGKADIPALAARGSRARQTATHAVRMAYRSCGFTVTTEALDPLVFAAEWSARVPGASTRHSIY